MHAAVMDCQPATFYVLAPTEKMSGSGDEQP